jgi:hypothetical protein
MVMAAIEPVRVFRTIRCFGHVPNALVDYRRLGQGGSATVYSSTAFSEKRVAVKIAHSRSGQEGTAQLAHEAHCLALFNHPKIVGILGMGTCPDEEGKTVAFIALDQLPGRSLHNWLYDQTAQPLSLPEILNIVRQITSALQAINERGYSYTDTKPSNIMYDRESGVAVLIDCYLVKYDGSDIFHLGRTLFLLLTKKEAIEWRDVEEERATQIKMSDILKRKVASASLPSVIKELLIRMLISDDESHFHDCQELLAALA